MNGRAITSTLLAADGTLHDLQFECDVKISYWLALRVAGAAHTNPIWLRHSIEWCLKGVDQCWAMKSPRIRTSELEAARAAYDHARIEYGHRLAEASL